MPRLTILKSTQFLYTENMLSIEETRKLIDDKSLSDTEVEQIRDELYVLANLAFDVWRDTKKSPEDKKRGSRPLLKE